ncbi:MAG: TlpA disulfide reductase family protein [Pseudomonadota bacterium]
MRILIYLSYLLLLVSFSVQAEKHNQNLRTIDGESVSINDYAGDGRWLLVMLWATDCSICSKEMPGMSDFHRRHVNADAQVLGVALDGYENRNEVKTFMARHELSFPSVIAEMPSFALQYEAEVGEPLIGTPTYLLFNPGGELVANNPGPLRPVAVEQFMRR